MDTYSHSTFEDTRGKAQKFGAMGELLQTADGGYARSKARSWAVQSGGCSGPAVWETWLRVEVDEDQWGVEVATK